MFFQLIILIKYGEFRCNRRDREDKNKVNCKINLSFYKASCISPPSSNLDHGLLRQRKKHDVKKTLLRQRKVLGPRFVIFLLRQRKMIGLRCLKTLLLQRKVLGPRFVKSLLRQRKVLGPRFVISLLRQRKVLGPRFVISFLRQRKMIGRPIKV